MEKVQKEPRSGARDLKKGASKTDKIQAVWQRRQDPDVIFKASNLAELEQSPELQSNNSCIFYSFFNLMCLPDVHLISQNNKSMKFI